MKKWILFLFMAVLLCITKPVDVSAEEEVHITEDGFRWTITEDGTAADILDYKGTAADVVIPAEIEGYPVRGLSYRSFCGLSKLTSVKIPSGVTYIGGEAFFGCENLKTIELSSNLVQIGDLAFRDCTDLIGIEIPVSVRSIGDEAFGGCIALTSIDIPAGAGIGHGVFSRCSNLESINVDERNASYTSEEGVLFNREKTCLIAVPGRKQGKYQIPSGVTEIDYAAFWGCSNLTGIEIPDGVTEIRSYAFKDCCNLTNINIPTEVEKLQQEIFSGCSNLTQITIPESVTSIDMSAFSGCSNLTQITIPESVTSIGGRAFSGCSSLKQITIPESVASIGSKAFIGCSNLVSVVIPASVKDIIYNSFEGCDKLMIYCEPGSPAEEYAIYEKIPYQYSNIKVDDLFQCETTDAAITINRYTGAGTGVDIPAEIGGIPVRKISAEAFSGTNVIKVSIAEGIQEISAGVFENCSFLKTVQIPKSVTQIGENVFAGCDQVTILCDAGSIAHRYALANNIPYMVFCDYGDVNQDGQINASDALLLLKKVVKLVTLTDSQTTAADVNGNGNVESDDALLILKKVVKLIDGFPVESET